MARNTRVDSRTRVVSLQRFLLPNHCIVCHRMVEPARPDGVTCNVCRFRLIPVNPGCLTCGQPMPPVGPCRVCAEWPDGIKCRSAVWLDPEARAMVHWLKYRGFTRLGMTMAREILRRQPVEADVISAVPLGRRRSIRRGYNQSAYIARALGTLTGIPVAENVLERRRETRSQTELTPSERAANVSGAFAVSPGGLNGLGSVTRLVLIDDVFTTGSTLVEACRVLREGGVEELTGITFARARTFADVVAREVTT